MRLLAKVLLTLLIGLVLVLALSSPSQTTDIDKNDCKVCHTSSGMSIHHGMPSYNTFGCIGGYCHPVTYDLGNDNCLYPDAGCHAAKVE